jgi:phage tail-like protein
MKQSQIKRLLPFVFQRTAGPETPMLAVLEVMQAMHEPPESVLERIDSIFDPRRTPDEFVPYLAGWVDLGVLLDLSRSGTQSPTSSLSTGLGRLRELVASAATLSEWRGTRKGLQLFLEIATGERGFEINEHVIGENGSTRPFHVSITAPSSVSQHRSLIEKIIELEKPAFVTFELNFSPVPEAPAAASPPPVRTGSQPHTIPEKAVETNQGKQH